ncbi:MAG: hypothetical protein MHPSP_000657, partial [Paramarteilia canceri]
MSDVQLMNESSAADSADSFENLYDAEEMSYSENEEMDNEGMYTPNIYKTYHKIEL